MAAGEAETGLVPEWEELGYTPVVFVRVANTGLSGETGGGPASRNEEPVNCNPHPRGVCKSIKRKGLQEKAFA